MQAAKLLLGVDLEADLAARRLERPILVGIEIGDANGLKIPLGAASSEYILGAGDNNLKFQARYVSFFPVTPTAPSTDALTAGPADGTAQFSIAYN